jgi:hypothetical protein
MRPIQTLNGRQFFQMVIIDSSRIGFVEESWKSKCVRVSVCPRRNSSLLISYNLLLSIYLLENT